MILERSLEETLTLTEVARGRMPADLYLSGGKVVNVYSGEVLDAGVAVSGRRIAYVGGSRAMVGPDTRVLDATGCYLVPGYIEPHFHPDTYCSPHGAAMAVLPHGTTTIFSSSSLLPRILGTADFKRCMEELARLPVKIFSGVPEQKFFYPQREEYTWEETQDLIQAPVAFGYNEIGLWTRLLNGEEAPLRKILLARNSGKKADGHTGGCSYDKLNVMAVAGLTSCHESLNARQALDRLRLGFWVMLRESSNRHDLERLIPVITREKVSTSRLLLTADGLTMPDLVRRGHLDHLVRKAISMGVEPVTAYRLASLNVATYQGLDGDLGGIAPGRIADILLLRELEEPTPHMVVANGVLAAREGDLLLDFPEPRYYRYARNRHAEPARLERVQAEMFLVPAAGDGAVFPVMEMVNLVVNRRVDTYLPAREGYLRTDPEKGLMKVALLDRQQGRVTTGFLSKFGARVGGIASTENAAYQFMVAGLSEEDMALAANRALELRGGVVVAHGGAVLHELALPLGGLMSMEPVPDIARKVEAMNSHLASVGFQMGDPYYFFLFLPSTFFPEIRLTTEGIYDVKREEVLVRPRQVA